MATPLHSCLLFSLVAAGLSACGGMAQLPVSAGTGFNPVLPEPETSLVPVVNIAPAKGWPAGGKPVAVQGTVVAAFAGLVWVPVVGYFVAFHGDWSYLYVVPGQRVPGGGGVPGAVAACRGRRLRACRRAARMRSWQLGVACRWRGPAAWPDRRTRPDQRARC